MQGLCECGHLPECAGKEDEIQMKEPQDQGFKHEDFMSVFV